MINFIGDPLQFSADVESLILGKEPFFLSRIGGSEFQVGPDCLEKEIK